MLALTSPNKSGNAARPPVGRRSTKKLHRNERTTNAALGAYVHHILMTAGVCDSLSRRRCPSWPVRQGQAASRCFKRADGFARHSNRMALTEPCPVESVLRRCRRTPPFTRGNVSAVIKDVARNLLRTALDRSERSSAEISPTVPSDKPRIFRASLTSARPRRALEGRAT